jgi:spore coat protein U-like protein
MTHPLTPRRPMVAAGVALLLSGLSWATSQAATAGATFTVTADVQVTCALMANNLNFGGYTGLVELDSTTTLITGCSNGTPYTIGFNAGTSIGATVTTRKMTGPATELLAYSLSQDAAHSINWGNTPGVDTVPGVGTAAPQTYTVYGRVAAGQFIAPGGYSDTITVTVTF